MVRGEKTEKGWAAIDDFEFLQGDIDCSIVPSNADPTTTTTTTPATTQGVSHEAKGIRWKFQGGGTRGSIFVWGCSCLKGKKIPISSQNSNDQKHKYFEF